MNMGGTTKPNHAEPEPSIIELASTMYNHGATDACRDIGRLYMTLHKISIINRAREAKCSNS